MPLPTRKYKDLDLSFRVHPKTKDLVYIKDDEAIKRSIRNIVLTNYYERHFDDTFGTPVKSELFELMSFFSAVNIQTAIEMAIQNFEPRAELQNVIVIPSEEENGYDITIVFNIKNQLSPIIIDFFLERIR